MYRRNICVVSCYVQTRILNNMTITYIFHSCYVMEADGFSVIFDFYKDVPRDNGSLWIRDYLLRKKDDLYVLCTHSHPDHFNPDILLWKKQKDNIRYIFSKELLQSGKTAPGDAVYLEKKECFDDGRLHIEALGSTDIGHSFLLKYKEKDIFHAGDLNNWHWKDEVPKEEALTYENNFLCELELLAERSGRLYLAMFPIDPRLGREYLRGAGQFVRRIRTDYFLPMHFSGRYDLANAFGPVAAKYDCRYLDVMRRGQSFVL
ncbi:MAG TPA: hydrolase [Porphyromonadaceae bacterium]|nr:hydrolase [Porphyromonadaceae bacterium]